MAKILAAVLLILHAIPACYAVPRQGYARKPEKIDAPGEAFHADLDNRAIIPPPNVLALPIGWIRPTQGKPTGENPVDEKPAQESAVPTIHKVDIPIETPQETEVKIRPPTTSETPSSTEEPTSTEVPASTTQVLTSTQTPSSSEFPTSTSSSTKITSTSSAVEEVAPPVITNFEPSSGPIPVVVVSTSTKPDDTVYGIRLGGPPTPRGDEEKSMLDVIAFYFNLMRNLGRQGCEGFYSNHFEGMNLPNGASYKREMFCQLNRQLGEAVKEIRAAQKEGGLKPMEECGAYDFQYSHDNPIGYLRVMWYFAAIGKSLLLGSVQVIDNNAPLASLVGDLLTHITRVHTLCLVDPIDSREEVNPISQPFDVPLHPFLAYQLLVKFTDNCDYPGIPHIPELLTRTGAQYPFAAFPAKNTNNAVSYQFNWNAGDISGDYSPESNKELYIGWLGGTNNLTISHVRKCGEDGTTGIACGRVDLPKGFVGAIAAVLLNSNTANYTTGGVPTLLEHTLAGPAFLVLS